MVEQPAPTIRAAPPAGAGDGGREGSTLAEGAHRAVMGAIRRAPIASGFLFRAYNHVLRRIKREYTARAYYGARFPAAIDDMIPRTIFYFGVWEPNNSAAIDALLAPGDVFVDVGANIGYYSLLASRRVGPGGGVVSVEASPAIFAQLSANVAADGATNLRLLNVAASDGPGELVLYGGSKWNRGSTSTVAQEGAVAEARVPAVALDALLTPDERARAALMKIDIEGAELPVLRRLLDTLPLYSPRMCVLCEMAQHLTGPALAGVFDRLVAAGYEAYWIENEYDVGWYLRHRRPALPKRVHAVPERQGDVLFRPPGAPPIRCAA